MLPLASTGPLAAFHQTRFPIVQGPMTRVSDNPDFALEVARAGGLPMMAIALKNGDETRAMLAETRQKLGNHSWGVGILGFLEKELLDQQMTEIYAAAPPFAILSGGNAEQAATLEKKGIRTYLHAATADILRMFLKRGVRNFVLEGQEGGGHIGPSSSFILWDQAISILKNEVPEARQKELNILFAGGVYNATSAAMVSALAGQLVAKGASIGVIMGTAYLFTEEILNTGTIVPTFQKAALKCNDTALISYMTGRFIRCVPTPIVDKFRHIREEGRKKGLGEEEISGKLQKILRGKLRVAARGIERDENGSFRKVSEKAQYEQGVFMIGQVAGLLNNTFSISALHGEISVGSEEILKATAGPVNAEIPEAAPSCIAIVGMSAFLPKALTVEDFWKNAIRKEKAIIEIPADRWDWRLFYDEDVHAKDKTISKWGGFLDEIAFDPMKFGIPPHSLKSTNTGQLLVLAAVQKALEDANMADGDFDREHTSIILGSEGSSHVKVAMTVRATMPMFIKNLKEEDYDRLPEWSEETFAGSLTNVHAGRVANRLDLSGANYTVDSACASSLTAIELAMKELEFGNSNMVIAGGVDLATTPYGFTAFSKSRALSPTGESNPFDAEGNGIVVSEGLVILVLKRLQDAERDGDKIYAVLQGSGLSSDGKGAGLTAPQSKGQEIAFRRAYQKAGFSPSTIGFYEAHATGTAKGDTVEAVSLTNVLRQSGAGSNACAVGSAKALVGHTKTTAGAIGVMKGALALYHQTLPPHPIKTEPIPIIKDPESPPYMLKEAAPWFKPLTHPRRVGVSAFGFGGTNTHIAMEEYAGGIGRIPPGGSIWPCELFKFSAETVEDLQDQIHFVLTGMETAGEVPFRELAYLLASKAENNPTGTIRLSIVAEAQNSLIEELKAVQRKLSGDNTATLRSGTHLNTDTSPKNDKLVFLFPGQGSQYPDMARETTLYLPQLREAFRLTNQIMATEMEGLFSSIVFPPAAWTDEELQRQKNNLTATEHAQPAIGTVSAGLFKLFTDLGLKPDMVGGHSYGEFSALMAAGVIDRVDHISLSQIRGKVMKEGCEVDGTMAVVHASEAQVKPHITGEEVHIANINSAKQTVISGEREALLQVRNKLEAAKLRVSILPVAGPFHTPYFSAAQKPLSDAIDAIDFNRPKAVIYSNTTSAPYSGEPEDFKKLIKRHLLSPVLFMQQIERMYADGARIFLEVGPKSVLTGLVGQTLEGKGAKAISLEGQGGGIRGLMAALGELFVSGQNPHTSRLIAFRLDNLPELNLKALFAAPAPLPPMTHFILGNFIRPMEKEKAQWGKNPNITLETTGGLQPAGQPAGQSPADHPLHTGHTQPIPATTPLHDRQGPATPSDVLLEGYKAYQATMLQFLQTQEKVLAQFLGSGNGNGSIVPEDLSTQSPERSYPSASTLPPAQPPVAARAIEAKTIPEPQSAVSSPPDEEMKISRSYVTEKLLELLSERTGYPPEAIGLDQSLEGELGVDSIKRIEVFDQIIQILPAEWEDLLQSHISDLMRVQSVNEIIALIFSKVASVKPPAKPASPGEDDAASQEFETRNGNPAAGSAKNNSGADILVSEIASSGSFTERKAPLIPDEPPLSEAFQALPRFVFHTVPKDLPYPLEWSLKNSFIITRDNMGIANQVASAIESEGGKAFLIGEDILSSPELLDNYLEELLKNNPTIYGILHLTSLGHWEMPEDIAGWREASRVHSKSLFQMVRFFGVKEQTSGTGLEFVLGASKFGGQFGRGSRQRASECFPVAGSHAGLLRSLAKDWKGLKVRVVDFDFELTTKEIANKILDEVSTPEGDIDIGYPEGERVAFELKPAEFPEMIEKSEPGEIEDDWVVLVIGGAKGITAEITKTFARPGMKIILAGRSRTFDPDQIIDLGSHTNSSFSELIRQGVEIEYRSVDVREEQQMSEMINSIYDQYGRLDAVFSGVGILDDKGFTHKDLDSFDLVFDTKVDSAFLLHRFLRPESLKVLVFFGSASGTFGNMGQTDYAAANEVITRYAWYLQKRWQDTRVLTINWGPWASIGMVSTSPMITKLIKAQGMTPIVPHLGSRYFRSEIKFGERQISEVVVGEGYWRNIRVEKTTDFGLDALFGQLGQLFGNEEAALN
ncbi:MAG TPA: SDR family NAD(P)-dependent oxidoreductase [Flavilitoribacter sp.]|nr:SDR family NAD(P)-dependent oxidoreductase [Flavilitoribacter sp.]